MESPYKIAKALIEAGVLNEMSVRLDMLNLFQEITPNEYSELMTLLREKEKESIKAPQFVDENKMPEIIV